MPERDFSYDALLRRSGNKYALTLAIARRARQLHEGAVPLVDTDTDKPVLIALQEFSTGVLPGGGGGSADDDDQQEEEEAEEEASQ